MDNPPMASFSGSITTTGRSEAIRLDKALFKAHPEFRQRARVRADEIERDPVVSAYLAFLERDMLAHPERITALPEQDLARLRRLTDGVQASDTDSIPDDVTL
jgi:antitoxin PrlF